ncbi:lipopolysaccharide biosynthesis protein [Acinetobacter sp. IK40]|jgi:O-antigen/teichoic acid export membrane protein|uniref:lipopolysaccharide biosynthesis protein n=1 Tax=Acinetobacter sp. IK40 TaxID=2928897 RepID=UPI002D1F33F8|nr:oligosaccharide flippase family protein [Acinetobacter sp. IK40]MEB3793035.1 oligosaccharide flippase family protein [Acinetobacter sp. IK40]
MFKVKSSFARNILILLTGSSIAQAIPIAITPVLTRLYTPNDFGVLAIFVALTTILGSIVSGRYELAIILPEDDSEALNIAAVGFLITTIISIISLFVVLIFNDQIVLLLGNVDIKYWLYLVPFSIFFIGCFNVLNYFNTRMKLYKNIAVANVNKSLVLSSIQVGVGFLHKGATGLIVGQFLSLVMSNYKLLRSILQKHNVVETINVNEMKKVAVKYQDFPKYSTGAILANTLSYQLLGILISSFYSLATLGFYSLVQRVMGMPSSLIGTAVSQVYFNQANTQKNELGHCNNIFKSVVKKLSLLSFLIFIPAYFFIKPVFIFIFGDKWGVAGEYAQILIPFFAVRFVVAVVTITNSIFEKQKISLIWQIFLLIISMLSILSAKYFAWDFTLFLKVWVFLMVINYLILLYILNNVSKGESV